MENMLSGHRDPQNACGSQIGEKFTVAGTKYCWMNDKTQAYRNLQK